MNIQKHKRFASQHTAQKNSGEIREGFGTIRGVVLGIVLGANGARLVQRFRTVSGPFCGARTGGSLKPHRAAPPGHALFCPGRCWVLRGAPRGLGAPPHSPPSPPSFVPPIRHNDYGRGKPRSRNPRQTNVLLKGTLHALKNRLEKKNLFFFKGCLSW